MKTITIKQPWASLIVEGVKDIENRTWKTKFRGRILIHAGAKPDNIKLEIEGQATYQEITILSMLWDVEEEDLFGAIIGSVEIVDCVQNHPSEWAEKGVWNWVLKDPIKFDKPIPCKGKLSFWESDVEICHICGKPTTKDFYCEICNEFYCEDCGAKYDQFSQIDFNCCSKCANNRFR